MQGMRDLGNALVVALISVGLMIGALSISLVEFVPEAAPTVTDSLFSSPEPLTSTPTLTPTTIPTLGIESLTPTATLTFTSTPIPPSSCPPPANWVQITVQISETLDSIAVSYNTTKELLRSANCLFNDTLIAGSKLYVPLAPAIATNAPAVCFPGKSGWSRKYVVQPGDNLFRIATNYFTTLNEMLAVNCLKSGATIRPGEILWVPNVTPRATSSLTPLPGITIVPTDPIATAIPPTATSTPSDTPIPPTATTAPTNTPEPTLTASLTPLPVVP